MNKIELPEYDNLNPLIKKFEGKNIKIKYNRSGKETNHKGKLLNVKHGGFVLETNKLRKLFDYTNNILSLEVEE
ncbi:hypothetical protein GF336_00290 [Candidatus Woesearchaeota archaeon]|nr:hypothetical protein [Candidatus Woesearchaeota archaeon]